MTWKTYFGTNKEVFDAELYTVGEALSISLKGRLTGQGRASYQTTTRSTNIHIWADLRAVISRLQHTAPGPDQLLENHIIAKSHWLEEREVKVEIHWVPDHMGLKGNERVD